MRKALIFLMVLIPVLAFSQNNIPNRVVMDFIGYDATIDTASYDSTVFLFNVLQEDPLPDFSNHYWKFGSEGIFAFTVRLSGSTEAGDSLYMYARELDCDGNEITNNTCDIQYKDGSTITDITSKMYLLKDTTYLFDLYMSGGGKGFRLYFKTINDVWDESKIRGRR